MNNKVKLKRIRLQAKKLKNSKPILKITYQGKTLTLRYFDENPEIHHLYTSKDEFTTKLYMPHLKIGEETNKQQVLEISENEIKINGKPVNLMN